ncbi:MAG: UbiD family decarboxylase, partial [Planctomycetes bacterium]|nr:UbiD family decarboxylase [Planctomycetota bacterium]
EGPFGDHTGFYSLADDYWVFHVTAITMRANPIYQSTMVGPPPQEDHHITDAIERLFLPLMKQPLPEVIDYRLPHEGVAHNLMLTKIKKEYPGQGRKVAHAVWGLGQAMFTKLICVSDTSAPD